MRAHAQHLEFAPPPPRGTTRSVGASLVVHALLLVALTAGIQWKQDDSLSVESELWSAVPMAAAPKLVEVETPPPPPEPTPKPVPVPKPVVKPPEPIAPNRDADIALAKKRKIDEAQKQEAKREEEKHKEALKKEDEKKAKAKLDEDKRKLEAKKEEARKDKERKEKEAKKLQEQKDSKASAEEAKKLDAIRKENMKRIAGLAGASGSEGATGTAMKSSGPSDSYGGRIRARVKPNITFTEDVVGNPAAEVEVNCAPDGTIVSRKLLKSSGNTPWDNAVLKAIDKTEVLPRDTDGRVHTPLLLVFRPKD